MIKRISLQLRYAAAMEAVATAKSWDRYLAFQAATIAGTFTLWLPKVKVSQQGSWLISA